MSKMSNMDSLKLPSHNTKKKKRLSTRYETVQMRPPSIMVGSKLGALLEQVNLDIKPADGKTKPVVPLRLNILS